MRETYLIKKYIDRLFCPANLSDFNDKALFAAIENDNVVKIHQLLAYGVSPNVTGGKLFTSPLHYTCKSGSVTASILLLYAGANPWFAPLLKTVYLIFRIFRIFFFIQRRRQQFPDPAVVCRREGRPRFYRDLEGLSGSEYFQCLVSYVSVGP